MIWTRSESDLHVRRAKWVEVEREKAPVRNNDLSYSTECRALEPLRVWVRVCPS